VVVGEEEEVGGGAGVPVVEGVVAGVVGGVVGMDGTKIPGRTYHLHQGKGGLIRLRHVIHVIDTGRT
jgi:hypothetical protein